MLLTLPFSSTLHHLWANQTLVLSQNEFLNTDAQTHNQTHRPTRVGTERRQDIQDRNRDWIQKTTDENQETGRETRTVVRNGVHCDACCCDGGWVVVWKSCVLLCALVGVVWLCVAGGVTRDAFAQKVAVTRISVFLTVLQANVANTSKSFTKTKSLLCRTKCPVHCIDSTWIF